MTPARLVETFLMEQLAYLWEEVHEEAKRLEHAVSDVFTERLADRLGHPKYDPHGNPIPIAQGTLAPDDSWPLSESKTGGRVRISRVSHEDATALAHMREHGLVPGKPLNVKEVRAVDGLVIVENEYGGVHSLGSPLAGSIFVRSTS